MLIEQYKNTQPYSKSLFFMLIIIQFVINTFKTNVNLFWTNNLMQVKWSWQRRFNHRYSRKRVYKFSPSGRGLDASWKDAKTVICNRGKTVDFSTGEVA